MAAVGRIEPKSMARASFSTDAIVPLLLFAFLALVPLASGETYLLNRFIRIMIFAIAAMGLDLLVGYGGLISFGHAAFMGIGAYAVGILAEHSINEAALALPVALTASMLFGLLTGMVSLRARGVYFIMITLAF